MPALDVTMYSLSIALADALFVRGVGVLKLNNALRATLNTLKNGVGLARGFRLIEFTNISMTGLGTGVAVSR